MIPNQVPKEKIQEFYSELKAELWLMKDFPFEKCHIDMINYLDDYLPSWRQIFRFVTGIDPAYSSRKDLIMFIQMLRANRNSAEQALIVAARSKEVTLHEPPYERGKENGKPSNQ